MVQQTANSAAQRADILQEDAAFYLVIGQGDVKDRAMGARARALNDFIVARGPLGFFSVRLVEDECGPAVHCMFECKEDADRLASTVRAIHVVRYDGYRSQRAFHMGDEAANKIYWALACLRPAANDVG